MKKHSYLEKTNTDCLRGILAIMVLFSHRGGVSGSHIVQFLTHSLLGAVGVVPTFIGTELFSLRSGTPFEGLYSYFSIGVLLQSVAVFIFFKEKVNMVPSFGVNFLMFLSKQSFGVYLIHVLFIRIPAIYHIDAVTLPPFFAVPIVVLIVLLCSYCSVSILRYIPLIGKHIV